MINESLQFIADELNKYLVLKMGPATEPPRLVLGNVSRVFDGEVASAGLNNKAILSLVNVEEDRISKQQENFVRTDVATRYKSPQLYLNVYILFAVNRTTYSDNLLWLSYILQFFQFQHVFTPITHPALDPRIQKLIVDLCTLNFEQVNHLWSTLGGKYIPSVLYKVRQLTIDEDLTVSESGFIKEVQINDKVIQPVTS
ncbi:DUF4255 domain-containing protein [Niastella caeni]|uniref:DUF4255 domain-containing protein n=1 Tax=Niastella caeni TaxID=2569763 RepID=A0A4S8I0B9_9BACT|nr:DUF4255 domain-containing protein [Niastella caeni]THU40599.1 DUF4255 domain-containing protein [Niastella caeni]